MKNVLVRMKCAESSQTPSCWKYFPFYFHPYLGGTGEIFFQDRELTGSIHCIKKNRSKNSTVSYGFSFIHICIFCLLIQTFRWKWTSFAQQNCRTFLQKHSTGPLLWSHILYTIFVTYFSKNPIETGASFWKYTVLHSFSGIPDECQDRPFK